MKIYITTPTVNLPPKFMKLALTGWLHEHPGVKTAAMVRKGVYNDDMLYRFLNEQGIDRVNWSHYFKENPHLTEYTWDLIAIRWEMPDWVVILQGEEEDERLTYTKEVAERFDFNVAVLSPHDRIDPKILTIPYDTQDLLNMTAPVEVFEAYGKMNDPVL